MHAQIQVNLQKKNLPKNQQKKNLPKKNPTKENSVKEKSIKENPQKKNPDKILQFCPVGDDGNLVLGDAEKSCESSSSEQGVHRRAVAQLPHVGHREGGGVVSSSVAFNIQYCHFQLQ